MAVFYILEIPGVDQRQYDQVISKLNWGGHIPPGLGLLFLAAGPMEGGWRVVNCWESEQAFQAFLNETLGKLQGEAGIPPVQPKKTTAHTLFIK